MIETLINTRKKMTTAILITTALTTFTATTTGYSQTKNYLDQGLTKRQIEKFYESEKNKSPLLNIVYMAQTPGKELAYCLHEK